MSTQPARPTPADVDTHELHEADTIVNGNAECNCRACARVAAWVDAHTPKAIWQLGGAL